MNAADAARFAGLFLVFATPAAAGAILSFRAKKKLCALRSLLKLAEFIKSEISSHMTRQEDIFAAFSDPYLEKNGFLALLRNSRIDGSSALGNALENFDGALCGDEEMKAVREMADTLGKTSLPYQISSCEKCIGALSSALKAREAETAGRSKVFITLGACFGLCFLILFA